MSPHKLHGIEITIPASWRDHSVHHFVSPPRTQAPTRASVGRAVAAVHRNVIVRRLPVPPGITSSTLASLFERSNEAQLGQDPSFRVGKQGRASVQARPAAWQDATFVESRGGTIVFQRHVGILVSDDDVVLVTVTSDAPDVDALLTDIGIVLESPTG